VYFLNAIPEREIDKALEDTPMKRTLVFAIMLTLLSARAFAGRNSQTVNIPEPMKAGTTQLAAGDYNVTWTGTGSNIQVTFMQNRKVFATVPAQLVVESNKNQELETKVQGTVETLESIRMRNMTLVLESPSPSEK
jgi:hypothetical protein